MITSCLPVWSRLQRLQETEDFRASPVSCADEAAANTALTVDDVGFGPLLGAKFAGGCLFGVADSEEIDVPANQELPVSVFVFVDADGEDRVFGMFMVKLGERGQFENAGFAPACPEVEQHDLASVVGQADGGGAIGNVEVWGGFARLRGVAAPVAGCGQQRQGEGCKRGDSPARRKYAHKPIIRSGGRSGDG